MRLHPVGEAVELRVDDRGAVTLRAPTGSVGPGYHQFLCRELHELGAHLGIAWARGGDAFFDEGDQVALYRAFRAWLRAEARRVREAGPDPEGWLANLVLSGGYRFRGDGVVATPTGPRDARWLDRVIADPRAGDDAFPWWSPERDAAARLGRALALLWTDVRWRPPTCEDEAAVLAEVCNLLDEAWRADRSLCWPWAAWAEVLDLFETVVPSDKAPTQAGLGRMVRQRARRQRAGPKVGYRQHPVEVTLFGRWSLCIPGFMGESWEATTWTAWSEGRTVWFSAAAASEASFEIDGLTEVVEDARDRQARLGWTEEDGEPFLALHGRAAAGDRVGLLTVCVTDAADRDWAIETWRSLRVRRQARSIGRVPGGRATRFDPP